MIKHCPSCGYSRQATDTAPATECPKCRIVFDEFMSRPSNALPAPAMAARPRSAQQKPRDSRRLICKQCGTAHAGERVLPGSGWIEFVLWFAYIVPGLIYSIWRRSKRHPTCGACGSRDLVDVATPVGSKLVREHYPNGLPAAPPPPPPPPPPVRPSIAYAVAALLAASVLISFCARR